MASAHKFGTPEFEAEAAALVIDMPGSDGLIPKETIARMMLDPDGFGKFMSGIVGPELIKYAKGEK